jgi:glycosyltransferase involved in cell wall biosynthesis
MINEDLPLVSILCITFNHEKYIAQAIEGFLIQKTNFKFEIIIHDDASTDKNVEIIKLYQAKNPKLFKCIFQTENQYSKKDGSLENAIFSAPNGKYIAFCEGDDYWVDPYKLQKQVDFLEANFEYGLVVTDFNILDQPTGKIEESLFKNQPTKFPIYTNFEDFLLAAGYMAPCTWVCRKEFIPVQSKSHVDGSFAWLLDVYVKAKVGFISDTTTVYRVLEESASHSNSIEKRYLRSVGVLKTQLEYIIDYKLPESFKFKVLQKYYRLILPTLVALGKNEEIDKAMLYLPKEIRNYRDNSLFFFAKIPFGSKFILLLYWFKNNVIKNYKK